VIFVLEFGLNSYLSFNLTKDRYLFFINVFNLLPFLSAVFSLGAPFAIVYLVSLQKKAKLLYLIESNLLALGTFSIVLATSTIFYLYGSVSVYFIVACFLAFSLVVKQNTVNFFLAQKRLNDASFVRLNQKLIFTAVVGLSVFFSIQKYGDNWTYILILAELIGLGILQYKYNIIKFTKPTKTKSIFAISKYSFVATALYTLVMAVPVLALNYHRFSAVDIVSFSIAFVIVKYSLLVLAPFMQLVTPIITPIKKDIKKVKEIFYKYFLYITIFGIFSGILVYLFSGFIVGFFSKQYELAVELLKIFSWYIPILLINGYSSTILSSLGGIKDILKITLSISTIMLILSFVVLPTVDIVDYSIYLGVSFVSQLLITIYYIHKRITI
jgi:O-antigen/teichoic acid export membrane protein